MSVKGINPSWLDKVASAISPAWGASRLRSKVTIGAMTHAGLVIPGSRRKSMKGVSATANSPDADIIPKLGGTRALGRDLFMNSPLATSILRRHRIMSIGSGLQLQSSIDRDYLGLDADAAEGYERTIEREFDLWAESFNSDFDGLNYYGDNQALGYLNMLMSGDFFFMPVWRPPLERGFPYELCIKLIDADLVRNPSNVNNKNIKGGVEKDNSGRVSGYHVWNTYPNEFRLSSPALGKSTFVPVYDESGRQQIYHVFDPERISQRRGVALLANVADQLKQLTRLSEAELMSALVSSFFTVFVKDMSGLGTLMGPALTPQETVTGGGRYGPNEEEVSARTPVDGNDIEMGHGNVTYVDDKKDITIADPNKTDSNFAKFWDGIATQISGAANQPIEQAVMKYTTSYTAARAAANDVWQYRLTARTLINRKMNIPVFREQMSEGILRGRIDAPGYFDDYATMRAWTRSTWVGSGRGTLDPLREAKGSVIELNSFLTTHEQEFVSKHGGRWDAAMDRRAREQLIIERSGLINTPNKEELVGPDGQEDEDADEADKNT